LGLLRLLDIKLDTFLAVAKGIASGMPLGAMVAPAKIMDWEAGSHASTKWLRVFVQSSRLWRTRAKFRFFAKRIFFFSSEGGGGVYPRPINVDSWWARINLGPT
jgi:hypothetical protein